MGCWVFAKIPFMLMYRNRANEIQMLTSLRQPSHQNELTSQVQSCKERCNSHRHIGVLSDALRMRCCV